MSKPRTMGVMFLLVLLLAACGDPSLPQPAEQQAASAAPEAVAPASTAVPQVTIPSGATFVPLVTGYTVRLAFHATETVDGNTVTRVVDIEFHRNPGKDANAANDDEIVMSSGINKEVKQEVPISTRMQIESYKVWLDGAGNVAYFFTPEEHMWTTYVLFLSGPGAWVVTPDANAAEANKGYSVLVEFEGVGGVYKMTYRANGIEAVCTLVQGSQMDCDETYYQIPPEIRPLVVIGRNGKGQYSLEHDWLWTARLQS